MGGVIDSDTAYVKDARLKPIQKQLLSVSPNPSIASFLLNFGNSALSEINVRITDLNGRMIENKTLQLQNGQANLEVNEVNGVYLMYIEHTLGEEVQKLVIQK